MRGVFIWSEHLRKRIEIGILFSQGGDYDLLSQASREGALKGIATVNADPARRIAFAPVERNPEGRAESYGALCAEILRSSDARHVIGCTTSSSRKEVIPTLERHDGMLWYAAPYEGFEANEHVVYLHACPNQHIVPLLHYVLPRYGADAFLLGSNYVWGWELNRVARDIVGEWNGRVLGERYLPLGDTDISHIIAEIRATRPSFVLNNLIGQSSYAFLKAYAALGREGPAFLPENCPVLSCDLMESELAALDGGGEGNLVIGPYFAEPGGNGPASSMEAAAHASVLVLAELIEHAGTDDPASLAKLLGSRSFRTPLGPILIDPQNQHAHMPVLIGRIEGDRFRPVWKSGATLAPDPYLSRHDARLSPARPSLKVIS
ncbi:MAG TPA: transporter substrate-binding protein [Pseudaminobacter sp.]|nr:transporter substrate-binding protein [Pseudaminobacter sp.]